jgi:hypothetical protein
MGSASSSQHWNLDWNAGGGCPFSSFSSSSFSFSSSSSIVIGPFEAMKITTKEELAKTAAAAAVAAAAVAAAAVAAAAAAAAVAAVALKAAPQLSPQLRRRRRGQ